MRADALPRAVLEQLRELTRGSAQVTVSKPFYAPF